MADSNLKYKGILQQKSLIDGEEAMVDLLPETTADQVVYGNSTVQAKLDTILSNNGGVANSEVANKLKYTSGDDKHTPIFLAGIDYNANGNYEGKYSSSLYYLPSTETLYVGNVQAITNGVAKEADKATNDDLNNKISTTYVKITDLLTEGEGLIKSSLLPGYVDDVVEVIQNGQNFEVPKVVEGEYKPSGDVISPETGKIYVDVTNNKTYRWSGTAYIEISASLALGETSSTAYAGDKGKANANAITGLKTRMQTAEGNISSNALGLQNVSSRVSTAESDIDTLQSTVWVEVGSTTTTTPSENLAIGGLFFKRTA